MGVRFFAHPLAPMTADAPTLDDMRVEIDEIDDAIHECLMRRAEIVSRLKALKPDRGAPGAMRPAREAEILSRRLKRHRGPLQHTAIAGIWREIVAASLALQGPFSIAVGAPKDAVAYWDLARAHFGSAAAMRLYRSPAAALRAAGRGRSVFAVLPMPAAEEADPWWPRLAELAAAGPKIVARLPFLERAAGPSALVVAEADFGGGERVISLTAVPNRSRAAATGAAGRCLATFKRGSGYLHLIEVTGPIEQVSAPAVYLGGYAPQLRHSDLAGLGDLAGDGS